MTQPGTGDTLTGCKQTDCFTVSPTPSSVNISKRSSTANHMEHQTMSATKHTARQVFEEADLDKDGAISASELRWIFQRQNVELNQDQLGRVMKTFDRNADGFLVLEEFEAAFSVISNLLQQANIQKAPSTTAQQPLSSGKPTGGLAPPPMQPLTSSTGGLAPPPLQPLMSPTYQFSSKDGFQPSIRSTQLMPPPMQPAYSLVPTAGPTPSTPTPMAAPTYLPVSTGMTLQGQLHTAPAMHQVTVATESLSLSAPKVQPNPHPQQPQYVNQLVAVQPPPAAPQVQQHLHMPQVLLQHPMQSGQQQAPSSMHPAQAVVMHPAQHAAAPLNPAGHVVMAPQHPQHAQMLQPTSSAQAARPMMLPGPTGMVQQMPATGAAVPQPTPTSMPRPVQLAPVTRPVHVMQPNAMGPGTQAPQVQASSAPQQQYCVWNGQAYVIVNGPAAGAPQTAGLHHAAAKPASSTSSGKLSDQYKQVKKMATKVLSSITGKEKDKAPKPPVMYHTQHAPVMPVMMQPVAMHAPVPTAPVPAPTPAAASAGAAAAPAVATIVGYQYQYVAGANGQPQLMAVPQYAMVSQTPPSSAPTPAAPKHLELQGAIPGPTPPKTPTQQSPAQPISLPANNPEAVKAHPPALPAVAPASLKPDNNKNSDSGKQHDDTVKQGAEKPSKSNDGKPTASADEQGKKDKKHEQEHKDKKKKKKGDRDHLWGEEEEEEAGAVLVVEGGVAEEADGAAQPAATAPANASDAGAVGTDASATAGADMAQPSELDATATDTAANASYAEDAGAADASSYAAAGTTAVGGDEATYAADGTTFAAGSAGYAADGSTYAADGAVYSADGANYATDGSAYAADAAVYGADVSAYAADGTVYAADGASMYATDGAMYAGDLSTVGDASAMTEYATAAPMGYVEYVPADTVNGECVTTIEYDYGSLAEDTGSGFDVSGLSDLFSW